MHIQPTRLPGAALIEPERREDERGWFARVYCEREFSQAALPHHLVQTNRSLTRRAGTLRGMHYQLAPHGEDKLVRCEHGAIWDAIVDLRPDSPTCGQWLGVELSEGNGRMLLVQWLYRNDTEEQCSTQELIDWDAAITAEDRDILEATDYDACIDTTRRMEFHMTSDKPGLVIRRQLMDLLSAHGEVEVHRGNVGTPAALPASQLGPAHAAAQAAGSAA
jgi:dTDP-4-dehydrorhamnose 3,5-epimerase-like enzyme